MNQSDQIDRTAQSADNLLELLIKHQPDLVKFSPNRISKETGESVGEFIGGLRSKLIDMYNLKPHG